MENQISNRALVLSPPLEEKIIKICMNEGLIRTSGQRAHYDNLIVESDENSHILAKIFLCPNLKIAKKSEVSVELETDLLKVCADNHYNSEIKCDDMPLLLSYCEAIDSALDPSKVMMAIAELIAAEENVLKIWGQLPWSDGNGLPVLSTDFWESVLSKVPPPQYLPEQIDAYDRYRRMRDNAAKIIKCVNDLDNVWARKNPGDAIGIHSSLGRTYQDVISAENFEDGLSENDIFFLHIRALRTLPVGRSLKETLELGATPEGMALRQRVADLHAEVQIGSQSEIRRSLEKIEKEADDYRVLTSRIISPNTLSNATDVVLGLGGLVPLIGTMTSVIGILKSTHATKSSHDRNRELKRLLWARYQGRAL